MSETSSRYFNRELSWLEFNQRVLEEALDATVPLLERVKFLAISASNLDEFFRVRVGSLELTTAHGLSKPDPSGMTPRQQLEAISARVRRMTADQYACYLQDLEPQLTAAGIRRVRPDDLTKTQKRLARQVFENEIYSILTPMAVTSADDFPLLPNQMLNVCVRLNPPEGASDDGPRFAILPLGPTAPRFISLPADNGYSYLLLEDLASMFAERFFVGEAIAECVPFRVTRNADISVREDAASDLLAGMEEVLDERRHADCVRLEIDRSASPMLLGFLRSALGIDKAEAFSLPGPLDLAAWSTLSDRLGFDHLKYEPWPPQRSPVLAGGRSMFETITAQDVLLYHPYDSFEPVQRFVEEAAADPEVLAIKQILYRTSRDSPIVAALQRAAENGKHVTVVVELKARFDEARNIAWARRLEQAGAQVIYGVKGLKTHAKACLIVRREPHGIQRYVHFGTGNYNEATARVYSDASLFTADGDLGADVVAFFNAVSGYSQPQKYRKLEAAPIGLRDRLLELIRTETERARDKQPARIMAKVNALLDTQLIDALYEASQEGVEIRLNVRGICCLRPGVPGLSENIEVVSIVDRFLEHSRIMYFHHGGDGRVFVSSADWMPRNLDRRIELLVPIEDAQCRQRLTHILETCFADNVKARRLLGDGTHERVTPAGEFVRAQERLFEEVRAAVKQAEQQRATVFEPHLPGQS
jgi:polyphosphate kinase